jgi:hypothetical protein
LEADHGADVEAGIALDRGGVRLEAEVLRLLRLLLKRAMRSLAQQHPLQQQCGSAAGSNVTAGYLSAAAAAFFSLVRLFSSSSLIDGLADCVALA